MEWFVRISAGSSYGCRTAWYELINGCLFLRHPGDHDNLVGNSDILDFESLTLDEAAKKVRVLNETPVGHSYDGCHACQWAIEMSEEAPPEWLVYEPPSMLSRIVEIVGTLNIDDREWQQFIGELEVARKPISRRRY